MERPPVTLSELEAAMATTSDYEIEVLPDGSIRAVPIGTAVNAKPDSKPLTWLKSLAKNVDCY
jgi:hypothetical protein